MSKKQLDWAAYYVITSGNAHKAAELAGYGNAGGSAMKNLVNGRVMAEVQRLALTNIKAHLPAAITALVEVMSDGKADPRARVQAATNLLDRAGLKPKSDGPAVQVNVQINGQQAQAAIAEVWEVRERRLTTSQRLSAMGSGGNAALMSDIGTGMSDISEGADGGVTIDHRGDLAPAGDGWGGMRPQGPVPVPSVIPTPATEYPPHTAGGDDDA